MSVLTHKVRIVVRTKRQRDALTLPLIVSQQLYNAALEERSLAWSKSKKRITCNDQMKSITALAGDPSLAGLPVNLLRWPLKKLDKAFKGFFNRVRKGQTPGYPRYKSAERWDTFGYTDRQCWSVDMMRSARGTVEAPGTNVQQKTGLNRSIGDAAWSRFAEILTYKAARAGGSVVRVDPRNTSNECSRCHAITPSMIGDLFSCRNCGLRMDRDHNAALVIQHRGVVAPQAARAA